jgi:hypothetical protein
MIHQHPRARDVTANDRATMLLGMAADAAEQAAAESGSINAQLRAAMLRAMASGDLPELIRHAQTMRLYQGARSA